MISEIQIRNCASFDHIGVTVSDLKAINFIYGPNGSGKTTISNVLADRDNYPQCAITWKDNRAIKPFVYNRHFIDENFGKSKNQKGIFTLGKGEIEAKETIDARKSQIGQTNQGIVEDIAAIDRLNSINELNEVRFTEDCWKVYTQLKDIFKPAFRGCAFKVTFKERCKSEVNNSSTLLDLAVLKEKASRIYSGSTEFLPDLTLINDRTLQATETHEIWAKRIIGKEDVDIAALIKRLNNSDWVKQGLTYYSGKGDHCPFCQQKAPDHLEDQLNEYFDETYLAQIKLLHDFASAYATQTAKIVFELDELISSKSPMIDLARLEEVKRMLILKIKTNKDQIGAKIKEPGGVVVLESIKPELDLINELIQQGRGKISLHNDTVKNLSRESAQLTGEVWRSITEQLKPAYQRYQSSYAVTVKSIEELEMRISENEGIIKQLRGEIAQLEIQGTNIEQTKNEINALLGKFGFTGFQLAEASQEKGSYQIIRPNGERVERSLSEGEKTVVTFLYFYHLLKGSVERDSISADRIVVFDDPISSLDGDALFIVSHLVRKIIEEIRTQKSPVKQIIVLTHNVSFYTEISYKRGKGMETVTDETFWILRKEHGFSTIVKYSSNPIKSSYELLWREVKENPDSITLDVTLRRIIENYFQAFGGISDNGLLNQLDEKDQKVASSLLSWVTTVPEDITDDRYDPAERDRYLSVFRDIFEKTNHLDHYQQMMDSGQ